jgi:arylsulfatase A-like enzyme
MLVQSLCRAPNVLTLVLDRVRASDFPGGRDAVSGMPFADSLLKESISFPRTVSPSPWTVPSHASLFTGLYPWDHNAHLKSGLRLSETTPTLAEILRTMGYATASLSASGLSSNELGLTRGFETAAWGDWWERNVRVPSWQERSEYGRERVAPSPPGLAGNDTEDGSARERSPSARVKWAARLGKSMLAAPSSVRSWLSLGVNLANRVGFFLDGQADRESAGRVSPWIEKSVDTWLKQGPTEQPVFCFVNFLDGHEPYFTRAQRSLGTLEWWRHSRIGAYQPGLLSGAWCPETKDYQALHESYRDAIRSLDFRLRDVVGSFQEPGRWENTLMFVTADHGQAFGEHGFLLHASRVWDPVIRVPPPMRLPRDELAGTTAIGWASLIDLFPTVLTACGYRGWLPADGQLLQDIDNRQKPDPVFSIADGLPIGPHLRDLGGLEQARHWDAPWVAAYENDTKVVLDTEVERVYRYDIRSDPEETNDLAATSAEDWDPLVRRTRYAGRSLSEGPGAPPSPEVMRHLQSWGYD